MAEQILVRFAGAGEGVEELSWGQQELWRGMRRRGTWMPMGFALPLPPGTTVEDVVAELRFSVGRYQTLRTRLRHDPDGRTRQVVSSRGEVALDVVDAAADADPAEVAERVRRRYWETEYDFVTQWPVRTAVIRHRGVPTHHVMVVCHLVTDGFGALVMMRELSERDPVTGAAKAPMTAMQPLEQARWQRSPAGQRQCAAALRHWEGVLRAIPARRFPGATDPRSPRHWSAGLTSRAMYLALRAVAARTGADSSPLLLGVFAVALARAIGVEPVVTRVVVNNRFRPGLARTVSQIAQTGLCVLDVAGRTVEGALAHTRQRVIAAYKHAYYDPARVEALVERISRERGEELDLACFYSDRRLLERDPDTDRPAPAEAEIRAALPETTFRWESKLDEPSERLFLFVNPAEHAVDLSLFADTHHVSPAQIEAILRGMETAAVQAALTPAARVQRQTLPEAPAISSRRRP